MLFDSFHSIPRDSERERERERESERERETRCILFASRWKHTQSLTLAAWWISPDVNGIEICIVWERACLHMKNRWTSPSATLVTRATNADVHESSVGSLPRLIVSDLAAEIDSRKSWNCVLSKCIAIPHQCVRSLTQGSGERGSRPSSIHYLSGASYSRVLAFCGRTESNRSISHEQSDNSFSLSMRSILPYRVITRIKHGGNLCGLSAILDDRILRDIVIAFWDRDGIVQTRIVVTYRTCIRSRGALYDEKIFLRYRSFIRAHVFSANELWVSEIEAARARWKSPSRVSRKNCFRSGPHRDDSCPFRIIRSRHGGTFAASSFFVPWILKRRLIMPRDGNLHNPFSHYRDAGSNKKDRSRYRSSHLSKDDSDISYTQGQWFYGEMFASWSILIINYQLCA